LRDLQAIVSLGVPLKQLATEALEAGFSKREVMEFIKARGFDDSQAADAVGISLGDLQSGKY
jgi:hypothetical protein